MSDESGLSQRYSQLRLCKLAKHFLRDIIDLINKVTSIHERIAREAQSSNNRKAVLKNALEYLKNTHLKMRQLFHNFYLIFASIEIENADELQKDLRASIPFINDKVTAPQEDPEIIKRLKSERDELLKVRNQKNTQMSEAIKLMRLLKGELEEPDLLPNIDHNQKFLDSIFR
ncbi:unnamed protein product [Oikopleura dioica]|uniref:Mediator of RNA polymerase II transcription subunit 30 n=1 Tax=Oikopleura dioica TaxID=34765 RepID=E4Y430_OIKDI|nr:unnamed protein product [Oikopleura dioica]